MYAPVIEIVVAMVIKAPHPPSLWSDSGVSAGVVDREEWNTINVFRSMKRSINLLAQVQQRKG